MRLQPSQNTCSMSELCEIYGRSLQEFNVSLLALLEEAEEDSARMIIANLAPDQHKRYGRALRAAGFRNVGKYWGNSNSYVQVWIHGLAKPRATRKSQ